MLTPGLQTFQSSIATAGFAVIPGLLSRAEAASLAESLEYYSDSCDHSARSRQGGVRLPLHDCPAAAEAAQHPALLRQIEAILGPDALAVRAILFDKTPAANWKVSWHQDLTIAVAVKHPEPGFSAWSEKDGICHVQPPVEILDGMLAARIHLDDCGADNGPLRVLPGSHRSGRLNAAEIAEWRTRTPETVCTAHCGGVLFLRPLLLHASSAAVQPARRRVLHLEYAAIDLPGALLWHENFHPRFHTL